jgi:CubicO group peptidase (beta-lactamase class C family)
VDALALLLWSSRPLKATCRVPRDLETVVHIGEEVGPYEVGSTREDVRRVWSAVETLYRTGLHPAIQLCVRRRGAVLLNRAIGHASGNAPDADANAPRIPIRVESPFLLYSASKAITAMVIHKLDERRLLHLDDRICDYIPEFGVHGKEWITIRHVLGHRAGIPNLPAGALDLELLERPEEILSLLCETPVVSHPGRRLAYHAVTGGFVLGEVVRRVTGQDIRSVLRKELLEPLGFRWMNYGVKPEDAGRVVRDAVTGLPVLPPFTWLFRRALGTDFANVVRLAGDPRFLTSIVPAANVVSTAVELCAFYQCLLDEGELGGVRVFDARTVRHATTEQTFWELDLTLGLPLRYGLGFMLGGRRISLFGPRTPHAFGHLGFTNILSWADPDRALSAALITSGKAFLSLDSLRLMQVIFEIGRAFPPE